MASRVQIASRETLGLWPIREDGLPQYPDHYYTFDPSANFWIDNFLYCMNWGIVIFIINIAYGVIVNIKRGLSYPLCLKMGKMSPELKVALESRRRSWAMVFEYIFN